MARPTAAPGAPGTSVVAAAARGPHVVRRALAAGETWVFAALIIMMAIFTGLAPGKFLTLNDLSLNAQTTAPFLLMSVGETFVIITAGIDLSVGFVLVLSGVVAGEYYLSNGGPNAGAGTIWVGAIFGLAYFSTTTISGHPLDNLVVITAEMKAKYPNITVLGTQYDNDSSATAASQVEADITAHPNLSGVFATNVLSAQGAATGIQHAGASGKVKVATFDAEPQQITALKSNTIQLAIAQSPYLEGQDGVEQAVNALSGKPVTANIGTPLVAITQANVNSASVQKNIYVSSC
jgi:ABC-type sugar transport system substrate-binding protein